MKIHGTTAFLSLTILAACSASSNSDSADLMREAEAAAAAAASDVSNRGTEAIPKVNPADGTSDQEELIKTFLNLNHELCADVISTRPLASPDMAEVVCQEYTARPGRVTYTLNLATAQIKKVER